MKTDSPIRFVAAWHIVPGHRWALAPHSHEYNELVFLLRGRMRSRVGERHLTANVGDALLYAEGVVHEPLSQGDEFPEMMTLNWRGGIDAAGLVEADTRYDRNDRIRRQLSWILELYPSRRPEDQAALEALTVTVVHELGRLSDPAGSALGDRIRRYIRANLANEITLTDLAAEARMSKYHFARVFKQATGQTPMEMLRRMRIEMAQALILETDMTLETIAGEVGLADASHLSHVFRRETGQSPGSLRRL